MYRVYRKKDDLPVDRPYNVVSAAQAVGFYISRVIKEPWRRDEFYALEVADEPSKAKASKRVRTAAPAPAAAKRIHHPRYPNKTEQTEFAFQ